AAMMRKDNTGRVNMNGTDVAGTLCFSLTGYDDNPFGEYYWQIVGTIGVLLGIMLIASYRLYLKGRYTYIVSAIAAIYRYEFLISQLVIRDFKSKYKRSILGVFWSFLNPLLTMTVQFLVFSTFFKANTQNYPVYLLSGVVCFSFFNECTTMCLTSISGNSRLITKVYIPKYIFPLARTISSSVNLAISLVPLFLACLVLGVAIRPQALLFFYFLVCLIVFSLGIGLFLSVLMVFFRDIQFLWTVLIQIWQYATPIFYPAEIVPEKYRFILRFNPLYHFIGNARTCLIDGISPEPRAYIFCFIFALVSILIGSFTFKKTQGKFALYL
ncbi:MAG: ABC transporter permease, partial [Erysipelotrichaceae bacterium]|nr:ABC transporter permease [Erysipelotrichaceae bacterium]